MPRVTVHHLTAPACLPLIEEFGLRTRADLSGLLGPLEDLDRAAPGTYANGRRVSGWLSLDHGRTVVDTFGVGLVSWTVDPARTLAAPASARDGDLAAYWEQARPLSAWLGDSSVPDDLEVHQNVGVRAKHLRIHAPLCTDEHLGDHAPLIAAVADQDRLSAKALMHLALIASDGDLESADFLAACAFAWRDEPDDPSLSRELAETDPDRVAAAVLAENAALAPEAVARLRAALEETREMALQEGIDPGQAIFQRSGAILESLDRGR
ncbi:MAG: hypothetical protein WD575_03150 [Nitriliruptoraceae bacterium]